MKVLIAEDDEITSQLFSAMLSEAGHTVLKAFDGEQALAMAVEHKPSAILLDILMPKANGIAVLKALKSNEETKDIPVVICTNLQDDNARKEAEALGVRAYLIKSRLGYDDASSIIEEYILS